MERGTVRFRVGRGFTAATRMRKDGDIARLAREERLSTPTTALRGGGQTPNERVPRLAFRGLTEQLSRATGTKDRGPGWASPGCQVYRSAFLASDIFSECVEGGERLSA